MTNKTKNIVLVGGFMLFLLFCYKLAISKTINLKKDYADLIFQETLFKNAPRELSVLQQKRDYYDSILQKNQLGNGSIQKSLLKTINNISDSTDIQILEFSEPHTIIKNDLRINTYQFTLEGDYFSLINLIFKLEQGTKFGEISHLHFEKKLNYRTGKYYLTAKVLIRSFN